MSQQARSCRYVVHPEGKTKEAGAAFTCMACALQSVPLQAHPLPILTDYWAGRSYRVWRDNLDICHLTNVTLNFNRAVVRTGAGHWCRIVNHEHAVGENAGPFYFDPIRIGRSSTDDISEPATVASVEAFLKGAHA